MFCSLCRATHNREGQRYCAKCHAAYQREWRKTHPNQKSLSNEEMANRLRSLGWMVNRDAPPRETNP